MNPQSGGERERLGNAPVRDHGEVGDVRFRDPTKLFMMPHTVPDSRRTARSSRCCEDAGAAGDLAAGGHFHAFEQQGNAFLESVPAHVGGKPDFVTGRLHELRDGTGAAAQLLVRLGERCRCIENLQPVADLTARVAQFQRFGHPFLQVTTTRRQARG